MVQAAVQLAPIPARSNMSDPTSAAIAKAIMEVAKTSSPLARISAA